MACYICICPSTWLSWWLGYTLFCIDLMSLLCKLLTCSNANVILTLHDWFDLLSCIPPVVGMWVHQSFGIKNMVHLFHNQLEFYNWYYWVRDSTCLDASVSHFLRKCSKQIKSRISHGQGVSRFQITMYTHSYKSFTNNVCFVGRKNCMMYILIMDHDLILQYY